MRHMFDLQCGGSVWRNCMPSMVPLPHFIAHTNYLFPPSLGQVVGASIYWGWGQDCDRSVPCLLSDAFCRGQARQLSERSRSCVVSCVCRPVSTPLNPFSGFTLRDCKTLLGTIAFGWVVCRFPLLFSLRLRMSWLLTRRRRWLFVGCDVVLVLYLLCEIGKRSQRLSTHSIRWMAGWIADGYNFVVRAKGLRCNRRWWKMGGRTTLSFTGVTGCTYSCLLCPAWDTVHFALDKGLECVGC